MALYSALHYMLSFSVRCARHVLHAAAAAAATVILFSLLLHENAWNERCGYLDFEKLLSDLRRESPFTDR